jgi:hypothetical protein
MQGRYNDREGRAAKDARLRLRQQSFTQSCCRMLVHLPCFYPLFALVLFVGRRCLRMRCDCLDPPEDGGRQGMHAVDMAVRDPKGTLPYEMWTCLACGFDNEAQNLFCALCETSFESVRTGAGAHSSGIDSGVDADPFDEHPVQLDFSVEQLEAL